MRSRKYSMDDQQAENTLQKIFSACNIQQQQENETAAYWRKHYRKEARYYRFNMIFISVIIVCMLFIPFIFFTLPVKVQNVEDASNGALSVYQHHLDSETNIFYLTLNGAPADYEHIEIINSSGEMEPVLSFDRETSTITFSFQGDELNLYIPDEKGDTLHLLLSPND